jgi:hypothetical protein
MEAMRERWSDDRLDDLNSKVDALRAEMREEFLGVREEFQAVRAEMREEFLGVREESREVRVEMHAGDKSLRAEMREGFGQIEARLDRMQQTMILFGGGLVAAMLSVLAAMIALITTQI